MATNLITRAEYKDYLGITTANKDDELDLLIPKVSSLVKTYCRRTFIDYYDEPYIEIFDGGLDTFILKEGPVREVVYVKKSTNYGQTYTPLVKYTDWVAQGDSVRLLTSTAQEYRIKGYQIVYLGGYEQVPADLKLAVMDLVEYYSKNNSAVHVNRDVTPNVTQIQYIATTNFPAHIKRILDLYMADYS